DPRTGRRDVPADASSWRSSSFRSFSSAATTQASTTSNQVGNQRFMDSTPSTNDGDGDGPDESWWPTIAQSARYSFRSTVISPFAVIAHSTRGATSGPSEKR